MEVLQAPPLRAALARLWTSYLGRVESGIIYSGVAWFFDQLRAAKLKTGQTVYPAQISVWVEVLGFIFINSHQTLGAMINEFAAVLAEYLKLWEKVFSSWQYLCAESCTGDDLLRTCLCLDWNPSEYFSCSPTRLAECNHSPCFGALR